MEGIEVGVSSTVLSKLTRNSVDMFRYYLMDRDWLALNRYHNKTMTYAACTLYGNPDSTAPIEGDVEFVKVDFTKHERPDAFISVGECPKVMKVSSDSILPSGQFELTKFSRPTWERLYPSKECVPSLQAARTGTGSFDISTAMTIPCTTFNPKGSR